MRITPYALVLVAAASSPTYAALSYTAAPTTESHAGTETSHAVLHAVIPNHQTTELYASQFIPRTTVAKMDVNTDDFGYWVLRTPAAGAIYEAVVAESAGFGAANLVAVLRSDGERVQSQRAGNNLKVTEQGSSGDGNEVTGPDVYVHLTRNVAPSGYKMPIGEGTVTVVVTGYGS